MNSSAVIIVVATMILSGFFVQTECAVKQCYISIQDVTRSWPRPISRSRLSPRSSSIPRSRSRSKKKVNNGNWNNITFTITIGVVRGCTDDVDDPCGVSIERTIDDKGKTFKVTYNNKSCKTCKKNNCNKNIFFKPSNGHTSFIGSAELCAFIASLMVARMSYPTILS
ncbi:uncharacterized protein LOC100573240 isoform X2 [Acyrthosiphon pisum]|uniref:Uncharacterized protein n=1 Tax=Acyrthosiphon pisum TaxID=7029 RepID=A0A8R2B4D6_ACYPI|nr:uncharacterized protein LOC100573240 isoform X2 [Acyrthosiphon pisum]|eukprot:XP_008181206.1 PREDICTED: uncharacterized protein LOC100573240 isoform X2 [Acyrthosiphon pisum]